MQFQQSAPGNTTVPGALTVQSITTTSGPDQLQGPLTVVGAATFDAGISVTGDESLTGNLTFTGAASVLSGLTGTTLVGSPWLKIAQITASAGASSITFSSIPQTFTHLVLIGRMRNNSVSGDGTAQIRFNGVSTTNYDYEMIQAGAGTSLVATNPTGQTASSIGTSQGLAFSGSAHGESITFLPFYTSNGQFCTHYTLQIAGDGTSMKNQIIGGILHIGNGPITSINLSSNNDNLSGDTEFTLYGIP